MIKFEAEVFKAYGKYSVNVLTGSLNSSLITKEQLIGIRNAVHNFLLELNEELGDD